MALDAQHGFVKKHDNIEDDEEIRDVRGGRPGRVVADGNHARLDNLGIG